MAIISKTNRKRHTKPCLYFQTNDCPLSAEDCDFSHIIATPEQFDSLKNPQATLRTKPCRFFLGGKCRDGYWCRFKHPANSFATSRDSDASLLEDVPELDSDKSTTEDDDVDVRDLDGWKAKPEEHPKYRTRPCRNFILGKCIYGERCSYLHVLVSPDTPSLWNDVHVTPGRTASPSPVRSTISPPPARSTISSYFPTTPPLHRVPPTTPVTARESQSDSSGTDVEPFDLDASAFRTPVRTRFNSAETSSDMQTPSSISSGFSDDPPVTPAGATEYSHPLLRSSGSSNRVPPLPTFPLSPLSPLSRSHAHPRDYLSAKAATRVPLSLDYMNSLPLSPLSPLSSQPQPLSVSMYSPTSPVPLQIVHVPFAVPMYPEMPLSPNANPHASSASTVSTPRGISVSTPQKSPPQTLRTRGRAFSQPDVSVVPTSPESLLYRSKPCKFFVEAGKCQKGDQCNFSHVQVASPPGPLNEKRLSTAGKDSSNTATKAKLEKEQKATRPNKPDVRETFKDETNEDKSKSSNFYPINWRVVGGGVKIGVNKSEQRCHSEDASALSQRFSAFRNPFSSIGEHSASDDTEKSSLAPTAILKGRARSLSSTTAMPRYSVKTSSLLASRKGADKALSLSLQAYSFSDATSNNDDRKDRGDYVCNRNSFCSLNREASPVVVVVQGDVDEGGNEDENDDDVEKHAKSTSVSELRHHQNVNATRAKSSPTTPVTAHHQIPNMVFAAESP